VNKYNAKGQQVWRQLNGQGVTIHSLYDLDGNRVAEYNGETGAGGVFRWVQPPAKNILRV